MPTERRFVAESIEEMLVALANGIREAQEALNEIAPVDAFGRVLPTYHIPYLDFEIGVEITTQRQSSGRPILHIVKLPPATSSENSTTRSSISGRLIALPPGEGLPLPEIRIEVAPADSPRTHLLEVRLSNSAGELLGGRRVELNVDVQASRELSRVSGVAPGAVSALPKAGTRLSQAVLVTNADGTASSALMIDAAEDAAANIVVTARAGTSMTSVALAAGAS